MTTDGTPDIVLSIRQPWAWCILHAGKDIENRSWPTRRRGRFLIHAASGMTRSEWTDAAAVVAGIPGAPPMPESGALVRGAIIGSAVITDDVTASRSPWFFGAHGFVLADPRPLPVSVPCTGRLGFWRPTDVIRAAVTAAWSRTA